MNNVDEILDKALSYFKSGYNCAESTLLAIAKDVLEIDRARATILTINYLFTTLTKAHKK